MSDEINNVVTAEGIWPYGRPERSTNRALGAAIVAGSLAFGASFFPLPSDSTLLDLLSPGQGTSNVRDMIRKATTGQIIPIAAMMGLPDLFTMLNSVNSGVRDARTDWLLELVRTYGLADVVHSLELLMFSGSTVPGSVWLTAGGGGGGGGGIGGVPVELLSNLMMMLDFLAQRLPAYANHPLSEIITTVLPALARALDIPLGPAALPSAAAVLSAFVEAPPAVVEQSIVPALEEVAPPPTSYPPEQTFVLAVDASPLVIMDPPTVAVEAPPLVVHEPPPAPLPQAPPVEEVSPPPPPDPPMVEPQPVHSSAPIVVDIDPGLGIEPIEQVTIPDLDGVPTDIGGDLSGSEGDVSGSDGGPGSSDDGGLGGSDDGAPAGPGGAAGGSEQGAGGTEGAGSGSDAGSSGSDVGARSATFSASFVDIPSVGDGLSDVGDPAGGVDAAFDLVSGSADSVTGGSVSGPVDGVSSPSVVDTLIEVVGVGDDGLSGVAPAVDSVSGPADTLIELIGVGDGSSDAVDTSSGSAVGVDSVIGSDTVGSDVAIGADDGAADGVEQGAAGADVGSSGSDAGASSPSPSAGVIETPAVADGLSDVVDTSSGSAGVDVVIGSDTVGSDVAIGADDGATVGSDDGTGSGSVSVGVIKSIAARDDVDDTSDGSASGADSGGSSVSDTAVSDSGSVSDTAVSDSGSVSDTADSDSSSGSNSESSGSGDSGSSNDNDE